MITYWQQEDGKLIAKDKSDLDKKQNTWVDARCVTRDDIQLLQDEFKIDPENMLDILDPDELSRIEDNDDFNYTLTIVRLPVFQPGNDISYFTTPIGIIALSKIIITICWTDCEVLHDFAANRVKQLSLKDFPAFTIRFMSRADITFLRYLKELNRRATTIQNEMLQSVQNHELIQLLNIQKSLVFFSTSLKSNQLLLEKLRKTKILKLDEEDQDWLDDVEIDNRQAMEMTDTYTNIMAGMNDAFASVLSNNLNLVMKTMTAWNLVLMAPTLVVGFFGINVPLPWAHSGWTGAISIGGICIIAAIFAHFFFMRRKLTSLPEQKKHMTLKQLRDSNKQKRFIKNQEKAVVKQEKAVVKKEKAEVKKNNSVVKKAKIDSKKNKSGRTKNA